MISLGVNKYSHNLIWVPKKPIGMIIFGWIEPKTKPLIFISFTVYKYNCIQQIRWPVSKNLETEPVIAA